MHWDFSLRELFFFCGDYEWGARLHAGKIVCCFGFTLWIFWLCKRGKKNLEAKKNVSVNVATELNSSHIQINVYLNSPFIMCFLCAKCILSLALYYNEHSRGEKFMLPNATLHRRDRGRERRAPNGRYECIMQIDVVPAFAFIAMTSQASQWKGSSCHSLKRFTPCAFDSKSFCHECEQKISRHSKVFQHLSLKCRASPIESRGPLLLARAFSTPIFHARFVINSFLHNF